jgi:hypothetical protein
MKESNLKKLIIGFLAVVTIGTGAKQVANFISSIPESASANNTIRIEKIVEESNFEESLLFLYLLSIERHY